MQFNFYIKNKNIMKKKLMKKFQNDKAKLLKFKS